MEIDKPCKERRCVEMIYAPKHAELQQQLDVPIQERKKYEDQLSAMKVEMKNLIESLDGGQFKMSDLQEQITTLTDQNEGYKHELISLREELSVTTVALNCRTPELLAPLLPHFLMFSQALSSALLRSLRLAACWALF